MTHAEIKTHRGVPTLFVNGQPHSGAMYTTLRLDPELLDDFVRAGVKLFAIDTTCGQHYYRFCSQAWIAPDEFDWRALDRRIGLILKADPQAHIILRVYIGSPQWWDALHPSELMRDSNGEPIVETVNFGFLGGIDPGFGPVKTTIPSFSSTPWREDGRRALVTYVRHVEENFGDAVVGYLLETGGTEEWYYWNVFSGMAADYSKPQQERFAAESGLTIPSVLLRRSTSTNGFFRDEKTERAAIAYGEFHNRIVAETLLDWAAAVKAETAGRKLCGAFYGYAFDLCRAPHVWPESGHLALKEVLDSPQIDFLVSPTSYMDRRPGDGLSLLGGPHTSVALHGKLWWNENDQYTHLTPKTGSTFYWRAENENESIQMHRREIAASICQGVPQWWFDMHGGWFSSPGLMAEIARQRAILEQAIETNRQSVAQVALVIDYKSALYTESHNRMYEWLLRDLATQLARCGTPFDVLLLDDLGVARDYRFYIFANAFALDATKRAQLTGLAATPGRTILLMHAPGIIEIQLPEQLNAQSNRHFGVAGISELTGFDVRLRRENGKLSARYCGAEYGPGIRIAPQFTGTGTGGGEALAFYADSPDEPALLRRNSRGATSIFAPVPGLPAPLLRELLQDAGVHIYSDGPDQVWACEDWLAISPRGDGPWRLRLQPGTRLLEVFSDTVFTADGDGSVAIQENSGVMLFRLQ